MFSNCYDIYFKGNAATSFGSLVDWRWMKAMAIAESGLDPEAVSKAGAVGVMQLMPTTAEETAKKLDIACLPKVPHCNIQMGIAYARQCWDIWKAEEGVERIRFMLGSYNAGPGNILKAQKLAEESKLPTDKWESIAHALPEITGSYAVETINYVYRVESYFKQLIKKEKGPWLLGGKPSLQQ